ncbi:endopeptidase La [Ignatzschineria ureiclastica]|uniref:Lon protease n=1 Tax=Ignatzschineria ureiclastica TaxID=472582 RepID=A0A2U2AEL0_9GAMM|nr:endopeptidase La [Ignatzschineria ureiclastica]PWD81091.1 endopeptidase La [Ignatzschineria ureiclastica]GGZ96171.1 Lon protease [Ignatzschineria ureiclastica]
MSDNKKTTLPAVENEIKGHNEVIVEGDTISNIIHILPLHDRPFFPPQIAPLLLNEEPWLTTLDSIMDNRTRVVGLILSKKETKTDLTADDFYEYGTLIHIHHPHREDGKVQFIAQGIQRFRVKKWISKEIPFVAQVEYFDEAIIDKSDEVRAYSMAVVNALKELIPFNPLFSEELKHFLTRYNSNDPSPFADFAASMTTSGKEELQDVLSTIPLVPRLRKVLAIIEKEIKIAKLHNSIREEVEDQLTDQQRQYFLREQLKVIQQELGISKDDKAADIDKFVERLLNKEIPQAAQERIDEELEKLQILETGSPEYGVTRNYLDIITDLPWGTKTEDNFNLKHARRVLDKDHFGLEDVKDRIIETLAVGKRKGEIKGTIILLVGPPGVGKTSIGRSVADSLGRKFYRFSLGGARDEAEIKGHRRTYIGAMPGKLIQALRETKADNPVIMLDEIDKMGQSYQGDPGSALLEVLDPAQNHDFLDHYLDVRYDLSNVLFVCTANTLDSIPPALLDRMDVIRLSGYILEEKCKIARQYLWPKQLEKAGFDKKELKITSGAIEKIIDDYAREAGVRQLEKQLGKIVRKSAVKFETEELESLSIGVNDIVPMLGNPFFNRDKPLQHVGVVTGLAWTSMGGVTLPVEAVKVHDHQRGIKLTGKLGEVMQESANIAYSYIMANAKELGLQESFFEKAFIHIHAPEGATPKDGPSAGITLASCLMSLALDKAPRNIAMTGELTLVGQVLPIGGVKEKLIAAKRVGIKEIIFPKGNKKDADELPDYLREGLTLHFVEDFTEVAKLLF